MSNIISNQGYCVVCDSHVTFLSENEWLRDHYICSNCHSIPRERALMHCIEMYYPNWKQLTIHESSPASRGASLKLKNNCPAYLGTHYFTDFPQSEIHPSGWRCENLESQTFVDESFDLVITQDVMEHIFNPDKAFSDIARTLKPSGAHIFTVPLVRKEQPSMRNATKDENGNVTILHYPDYHGNPIDSQGSLVTMYWGYDICDYILKHSGLYTTIVYIDNISLGIRAELIEVLISRKM
jgi:SAM-dependent methyltransferase